MHIFYLLVDDEIASDLRLHLRYHRTLLRFFLDRHRHPVGVGDRLLFVPGLEPLIVDVYRTLGFLQTHDSKLDLKYCLMLRLEILREVEEKRSRDFRVRLPSSSEIPL